MDSQRASPFTGTEELSALLVQELTETTGLNEYMSRILPEIGRLLGTDQICLVDYYEHTDHFDLLFFEGYPPDARHALQRRLGEFEVRRALRERLPYHSTQAARCLLVPCYFREILEAVVVFEGDEPIAVTEEIREKALVISRFLGLFMSSARLEVNRGQIFDPHDLQRARQIQLNFLPKGQHRSERCEVFGLNSSSKLVGGDYFDYFDSRDGFVQCILADACGHGMAAALIMSNFRGLLQSEVLRRHDIPELFESLNTMIHLDDDLIQYLTGVFLTLEEPTGLLHYVNAGHYEPVILGNEGEVRTLPGGGPPLGMFKGSQYPLGQVHLRAGDVVALYTDGLVDTQNQHGDYFGVNGIVETLAAHRSLPLDQVANRLVETARSFATGLEFEDDVTVFLLRLK